MRLPSNRLDQRRRFLLAMLIGLLVTADMFVMTIHKTAAPPIAKPADSPILASSSTPATTEPPTTVAEAAAGAPEAAPVTIPPAKPVAPPRDPYAVEPIQQIGEIEIPKIGLHSPIFHGISLRNIDQGPSHWPGTAFPGENGNAVFAGHRVTHTHPFLRINELEVGDKVLFTINGVQTTYLVTSHEVVFPTQLSIVNPTAEPTATLFGCHPPHSAKQRYVVHLALSAEG
jgi:sortase A